MLGISECNNRRRFKIRIKIDCSSQYVFANDFANTYRSPKSLVERLTQ